MPDMFAPPARDTAHDHVRAHVLEALAECGLRPWGLYYSSEFGRWLLYLYLDDVERLEVARIMLGRPVPLAERSLSRFFMVPAMGSRGDYNVLGLGVISAETAAELIYLAHEVCRKE